MRLVFNQLHRESRELFCFPIMPGSPVPEIASRIDLMATHYTMPDAAVAWAKEIGPNLDRARVQPDAGRAGANRLARANLSIDFRNQHTGGWAGLTSLSSPGRSMPRRQ